MSINKNPLEVAPIVLLMLSPIGCNGGGSTDTGGGSTSGSGDSDTASATMPTTAVDDTRGGSADGTGGTDATGSDDGTTGATGTTGDDGAIGMMPSCDREGATRGCWSFSPEQHSVGACSDGEQTCAWVDGALRWSACAGEQGPSVEACNAADDDCDGDVDESLGEVTCGLGECQHSVTACVDGKVNDCDPLAGATAEVCDGLDNDCQGDVDDGLGGAVLQCGLGLCAHTITDCDGGEPPICDPVLNAIDELCNGLDDDCDGEIDDGLSALSCGTGQCEQTIAACLDGVAQICDPFGGSTAETCDGVDNDCDGLVDEDLGVWFCGQGECLASVPACLDGVAQAAESCMPGGTIEICGDGLDNDCDDEIVSCAQTFSIGAEAHARPIDIVWVIDSSGSMVQELATVEAELNDFAGVLDASPSNNALHLIADRGNASLQICVGAPLGGAGCGDNPPRFWQLDTNGSVNGRPYVHSSNAFGRTMQQFKTWGPRLQDNSFIAFVFATDDDGDDPEWVAPQDDSPVDDCNSFNFVNDSSWANNCLWDDPDGPEHYTSLLEDHAGRLGFRSFMEDKLPGRAAGTDWQAYSIIGASGTGVPVADQFSCADAIETGDEYVKASALTGTLDDIVQICAPDWDFSGLADSIVESVPVDRYVLDGSPVGSCGNIDPATIAVSLNDVEISSDQWTYDASLCTLRFNDPVPTIGTAVAVAYDNF